MHANWKLIVVAVLFSLPLVSSTQAGTIIAGLDHRTADLNDTFKAFASDGSQLWAVDADDAKIGEIDPTTGNVIVAQGGTGVFTSADVTRHKAADGSQTGSNPLFNHGFGNTRGLAVHPTSGDIYLINAAAPSFAVHDVSAGTTTSFSTPFNGQSDAVLYHDSGEDILFVLTVSKIKGYLINEPPSTATLVRNAYPDTGSAGNYESLAVYDDMIYALKAGNSPEVWRWNPSDQSAAPTQVLNGASGYTYAAGLTFDDGGNMYIGDYGNGGDIYKYMPSGDTWGSQSLFVDDEVPEVTWLKFLPSAAADNDFEWAVNGLGDWTSGDSWAESSYPNAPNHTVTFGGVATSKTTAVTNMAVAVKNITFDNTTEYIVAGEGSVDLYSTSIGLNVKYGSHQFQAIVNLNNDTIADIAGGSKLTFNNQLNLSGNTLTKMGAGEVAINQVLTTAGGTVTGLQGSISGSGTVGGNLDNQSATVAPGNSSGILTIAENYSQGSSATLAIEMVDNSGPGTGHDQLVVTGDVSLDGTLDISTDAGLTPNVGALPGDMGDPYVIITASSRTGEFSAVNGRHAGAGIFYNVEYNATDVSLAAFQAQVGDMDGDRDVDITDFNSLASNFDPNGNHQPHDWTEADFDSDGDVDITDFNGLASNFAPSGYASDPGQVPEPGTMGLLLIGVIALVCQSVRRGNVA